MSYRVERAVSGRAGCKNSECKKEGIKIQTGELRLGTWVDLPNYPGSWSWKHWGCVTGAQIDNIRTHLQTEPGVYEWEMLDGYDDGAKGSLNDWPELQEKVRRVITQGHVDAEDWRGDPAANVLGRKGARLTKGEIMEKEKEMAAENGENVEDTAVKAPKKAASKKRTQGDADEEPPAKKARGKKATKKEESEDDVAKLDDEVEDVKPVKKPRAKKVKEEVVDEQIDTPAKKGRGKKAVKKEESDDMAMPDEAKDVKPARKPRAKKVKEEVADAEGPTQAKAPAKKGRGKKAIKEEVDDEQTLAAEPEVKVKKPRAKKAKPEPVAEFVAQSSPLSEAKSVSDPDVAEADTSMVDAEPAAPTSRRGSRRAQSDITNASKATKKHGRVMSK